MADLLDTLAILAEQGRTDELVETLRRVRRWRKPEAGVVTREAVVENLRERIDALPEISTAMLCHYRGEAAW